jgi:hypothetical protein
VPRKIWQPWLRLKRNMRPEGNQGCQAFLGRYIITYQNGEKCTILPTKIQNGLKIGQMAIKYTNKFHWKKGFLVWKIYHLATLKETAVEEKALLVLRRPLLLHLALFPKKTATRSFRRNVFVILKIAAKIKSNFPRFLNCA